jgi:hypothetical protein
MYCETDIIFPRVWRNDVRNMRGAAKLSEAYQPKGENRLASKPGHRSLAGTSLIGSAIVPDREGATMETLTSAVLFLLQLVSFNLGCRIQDRLPEHHHSRETVESVQLVIVMLVTFASLVLGLLTSSAKSRFDSQTDDLRRYGIDLIELDQRLREYGPDADSVRALLRAYTAAAIVDTWPGEKRPAGHYPTHFDRPVKDSLENTALGNTLSDLDTMVRRLSPADAFHAQLLTVIQTRMAAVMQQRWVLIESAHSTISWPFLIVLTFWLVIVFAIFGLSSPRNGLVHATVLLCALSISSSIFLILEFETPLSGLIRMSSEPIRDALAHMDRPGA